MVVILAILVRYRFVLYVRHWHILYLVHEPNPWNIHLWFVMVRIYDLDHSVLLRLCFRRQ